MNMKKECKTKENQYRKNLFKKIIVGIKDFDEGRIKTHEEVFSKLKEPINIREITDEEFNDKMVKSIE